MSEYVSEVVQHERRITILESKMADVLNYIKELDETKEKPEN